MIDTAGATIDQTVAKARRAIELFDVIETVDSLDLAELAQVVEDEIRGMLKLAYPDEVATVTSRL